MEFVTKNWPHEPIKSDSGSNGCVASCGSDGSCEYHQVNSGGATHAEYTNRVKKITQNRPISHEKPFIALYGFL